MLIIFIAIVATFAIFFIWSSLESFVKNIEEKAILITGEFNGGWLMVKIENQKQFVICSNLPNFCVMNANS